MGVFTFTDEYTSPITPTRLFKSLVVDSHNLIPKLMPEVVKSIELVQGDGGAGSVRQINFAEGSQLTCVKNRIDELNEETLTYKYALIEGGPLMDKFDSIVYEIKFEATPDGGSKNKMTSTYNTKGDIELKEEDIKAAKERALGTYKIIEAYLIENPQAYS